MHLFLYQVISAVIFLATANVVLGDNPQAAFIIIDVQDCFLPDGSLALPNGDKVIPVINSIISDNKFDVVVFTLDWHPPGHVSFASTHNKRVGDVVTLYYKKNGDICINATVTSSRFPEAVNCSRSDDVRTVQQKLWPDHCVQNKSDGPTSSRLSPVLKRNEDDVIVLKGTKKQLDSYSAFFDNGNFFSTDLDRVLKTKNIKKVFIAGFALDICVFYTSLHAKQLDYETYTVTDTAVGTDPKQVEEALPRLTERGIKLISHKQIPGILKGRSPELLGPCLVLTLVSLVLANIVIFDWFFGSQI